MKAVTRPPYGTHKQYIKQHIKGYIKRRTLMRAFSAPLSALLPLAPKTESKTVTPEERVWERLWSALDDPFGRRRVYAYRVHPCRRARTGYIWKGYAWPGVPEMLRDNFDGGDFRILIREGRRMVFSGNISVVTPDDTYARR